MSVPFFSDLKDVQLAELTFFTLRPSRVQATLKIKKSRCCDSFYLKVKTYFDTKFTRHRPFIKGFTHR